MENIIWEVMDASSKRRKTGAPTVTIGFGRLAINGEACDLVKAYEYEWAEIMLGRAANKSLEKIGIKFVPERTKSAIKVTKKKRKDKDNPNPIPTGGIDINSKVLIKELFGESAITSARRYLASAGDNNTIVIDLRKQL